VDAVGAGPSSTALQIYNGGIRVNGAGMGASTPVFVHVATVGNIMGTFTIITHPLTDGDPNAILIVTPSYNYALVVGANNPHPVGVWYQANISKWVINNLDGVDMPAGPEFNVLVIKP
jgi:hypothetical protein